MSAGKTPHYSHIVHDINSRGGLVMYFAKRGLQGEGWIRHLDTVVPKNGVLFHELQTVDNHTNDLHRGTPFQQALHDKAAERDTLVLPAGFYGEKNMPGEVPSFQPYELLSLMPKSATHMSNATVKRYQELQNIREMRAATGSLAWLAAHMNMHPADYAVRPAVLWSRTHSSSLPEMYARLGVRSEVRHLDAPLRYTYLHSHGLHWSDSDIQSAFNVALERALQYFAAHSPARMY